MSEWFVAAVATVLFVILTPGLLFQVPGNNCFVDFGKMETSGRSILVHAFIYFGLVIVFTVVIHIPGT
ncbi:hypothetical protein CARUB_v10027492mg [Capsella rubella]|uniref:Transmembrane protein n=1 Tax=Capsella rubella TaxID=81985 RepID=R0GJZ8_9BRAS|nr:uncharacterized protein LOC17875580 [Capsella rubella]EOA12620.1 hypothetical protein CARUB_v10027492mg [Capsella rubella]